MCAIKQHVANYDAIRREILDKCLGHLPDYLSTNYGLETFHDDAALAEIQKCNAPKTLAMRGQADIVFRAGGEYYTIDYKEKTETNNKTGNVAQVFFEFFAQWRYPNPYLMCDTDDGFSLINLKEITAVTVYMPTRTHSHIDYWRALVMDMAAYAGYTGEIDIVKSPIKGLSGLPFVLIPAKGISLDAFFARCRQ